MSFTSSSVIANLVASAIVTAALGLAPALAGTKAEPVGSEPGKGNSGDNQFQAPTQSGPCNTAGMYSQGSNEGRELIVVNAVGDRTADLYWVDFEGNLVHYGTIPPNGRHIQQTYRGHVWVSVNSYGYCDIVFTVENNVEIIIK